MNQLMRRARSAVMGIGLGVVAALAISTAPGVAQGDEEPSTTFLLNFDEFETAPVPGPGDSIVAKGPVMDQFGKKIGETSLACTISSLESAGWHGLCLMTFQNSVGDLYFTFALRYDSESEVFEAADGSAQGGTRAYKWQFGPVNLRPCSPPEHQKCSVPHSYWLDAHFLPYNA